MIRKISCLIFVLALTACGKAKNASEDYLNRLSNVLEVDLVEITVDTRHEAMWKFPELRTLMRTTKSQSISVREFLSLRQCALHEILARRNSQLGRLANSSQNLLSDVEILLAGPACVVQLKDDQQNALSEKLETYLANKQQDVIFTAWQAVLGGPENAKFWSTQEPPKGYPDVLPQTQSSSLDGLIKFVQAIAASDYLLAHRLGTEFEDHLSVHRFGDGGLLLAELSKIDLNLAQANKLVNARLDRPLCLIPSPSQKARYFENVISQFLIQHVQAQAVKLSNRYQQLMPSVKQLETILQPGAPDAYTTWQSKRDAQFHRSLGAVKQHVLLIQQLYAQCGLTPGNRVR